MVATSTLHTPLRARIEATVASYFLGRLNPATRLEALDSLARALLLLELEQQFHILIDAGEAETVAGLICLAETRVAERDSAPPAEPATLIDLAAERARRARSGGGPGEQEPPAVAPAAALPATPSPPAPPPLWKVYARLWALALAAGAIGALVFEAVAAQPDLVTFSPWSLLS